MNLSPSDIDKLGFRISKEGDALNEAMMKRRARVQYGQHVWLSLMHI